MSEIAATTEQGLPGRSNDVQLIAAALALVALADWLFWSHEPGIALFVFYAAVAVAILVRDQVHFIKHQNRATVMLPAETME